MTLTAKVALIVACCTLLMLGSYYVLSLQSARYAIIDFNKRSAMTMAELELDNDDVLRFVRQNRQERPAAMLSALAQHFTGYAFILVNADSVVNSSLPPELHLTAERKGSGFQFLLHQSGESPTVISIPTAPEPLALEDVQQAGLYWLPLAWLDVGKQQDQLTSQLNNRFMHLFLLLSLLAVLLAWLGARWLLQPVHLLLTSFAKLRSGQLTWRIQSNRQDEMGQLFSGFNQLADGLQQLEQQYQQMSADLAHELRTPLTAVVGRLEAMQDDIVPTDKAQLTQLQTDVKRISRIIDDLNLLSLTQVGQLHLTWTEVDIGTVLTQLQQSYQAQADAQGLQFVVDAESDLLVKADGGRLMQVLSNLLNNAFCYGASGCNIRLLARQHGGKVQILVEDDGPGLSPELQTTLFQRFNHSRSRGGSGLGLAICYQLCQLMQADIVAASPVTGGLSISISFDAHTLYREGDFR